MSKRRNDWSDYSPGGDRQKELWAAALEMAGGDESLAEEIYAYLCGMDREDFDED